MWRGAPRSWPSRSRRTRRRASSRSWLALLPASELPHRLEVDVEVVRGLAQRVADGPRLALRDLLEEEAHVLRQLAPAVPAQSASNSLVVIAARAARRLSQTCKLFFRQAH